MATETASLILEVDSTQVRRASEDTERLTGAGKRLEAQLAREATAQDRAGRATATANRMRDDRGRFVAAAAARTRTIEGETAALEAQVATARRWGTVIGLAITTVAGFTLRGMIQNTIEAEQVQAQLEARLKSTKMAAGLTIGELNDMAKALQNVSTFGDEAIGTSQSVMLTFTRIGREVFPQAIEQAMNLSIALKQDLQSATLLVGKALNDPVKGLTALSRAGVQFTTGQKALIKHLVETGDRATAQKLILRELETQMGGSARAARNTLGGALTALKERFGDLLEGDTGSDGVRGTVTSINQLSDTLNDPDVKRGFQAITNGALGSIGALADFVGWVNKAIDKSSEWLAIAGGGMGSGAATSAKRRELQEVRDQMAANEQGGFFNTLSRGWGNVANRLGAGTITGSTDAELRNREASLRSSIELDELIGLDDQAKKPKRDQPASSGAGGTANDLPEPDEEAERASKAAAKAAEARRKQRQKDLEDLRASLRSEEEAIQASYEERERIIAETTKKGSSEQIELSRRSAALRDEELGKLKESQARELEDLRLSLRTEEEVIEESYQRRLEIIDKNTTASAEQRAKLRAKVEEEHRADLEALRAQEDEKLAQLREGYMSEEELMQDWHERRRQEILKATYATEKERQELLRKEEERFVAEQRQREQNRIQLMMGATADFFGAMSSLMAAYGRASDKDAKKRFKMAQNFAIASAVVSTAAGVAKALEKGFPIGWIEAAAAAAAGAAQIVTIKSQQYSGAYDQGGQIPAGKWGWVGENGPERVRGPVQVTGRKTSERYMGGSGGPIQVNIPISIDNAGNASTGSANVSGSGRSDAEQAKELGNVVSAKVREELQLQQKQGGILWRMNNG